MKVFTRFAGMKKDSATTAYVEALVTLVSDYERQAGYTLDTSYVTAADMVLHLLEERGMSVNAFSKEVGVAQSALSAMLNGKRGWSKSAIVKICKYFRLNPALFLK